MGCVQSQPSRHSKYHSPSPYNSERQTSKSGRRSPEFYHQYQPTLQQYHHQPGTSGAVISNNEGQRQRTPPKSNNTRKDHRVPSPQHKNDQAVRDSRSKHTQSPQPISSQSNQSPTKEYSPSKSSCEKDKHNITSSTPKEKDKALDGSRSSVGADGTPSKNNNSNEDIQFRRQNFDRTSIQRRSMKRSRKASVNSNSGANSTPSKNAGSSSTVPPDANISTTPTSTPLKNGISEKLPKTRAEPPPVPPRKSSFAVTSTIIPTENKSRAYLENNSTPRYINNVQKENKKNLDYELNFSNIIVSPKYVPNMINERNDIDKTVVDDGYGQEKRHALNKDKDITHTNNSTDNAQNTAPTNESSLKNNQSANLSYDKDQYNTRNKYESSDKNNDSKVSNFSASDNVAALLAKDILTKNIMPNNITAKTSSPQKYVQTNTSKSSASSKSNLNGTKENTAALGTSVIRTRREAMRQAEEDAAKHAGRTTTRQHYQNGNDNNRRTSTTSKQNENQDMITQEEDCGRLI